MDLVFGKFNSCIEQKKFNCIGLTCLFVKKSKEMAQKYAKILRLQSESNLTFQNNLLFVHAKKKMVMKNFCN